MSGKRGITRRSLMATAAGLVVTKSLDAAVPPQITHSRQGASLWSSPQAFREAGGQVAAFFFGGWTQFGGGRNPAPWYWINHGFTERLPTRSVALPGHWLGWTFDRGDTAYVPVGGPSAAGVVDARITGRGDHMMFAPTGPRPAIRSPEFYAGLGCDYPKVRFHVRPPSGVAWRCAVTFETRGAFPKSGRVEVAEPQWQDGAAEITIDMSADENWMNGDIRHVAIEMGASGDGEYAMYGRFELLPSASLAKALATIQGLPQDQQWAADWQQKEASAHGIDAFFMCTYWNGVQSLNKSVIDAMFASRAAPHLKLGLYFDSLNARRPKSLAEFDLLLQNWGSYFADDRFWRIDGRPVIGWHGGETTRDFLIEIPEFKALAAPARLAAMVDHMQAFFRQMPGARAPRGIYLVAGAMVDHPYWTGALEGHGGLWDQAGFDAGTVYNQFQSFTGQRQYIQRDSSGGAKLAGDAKPGFPTGGAQTFEQVAEVYQKSAEWITRQSGSRLAYFMPASAGWDVRPWAQFNPRKVTPCAPTWGCTPDRMQFRRHLADVRTRAMAFAAHSARRSGPVVMINAWDEFGEGGFLCPSRAYGTSRLEAVRDIFGI